MRIDLNDLVKFRLTEYGKEIYRHQHDGLYNSLRKGGARVYDYCEPVIDERGYTTMELWRFMQVFGPNIGLGKAPVITPNALIDLDTGTAYES